MVNKDIEFEEVVFNADRKKNQHLHVMRASLFLWRQGYFYSIYLTMALKDIFSSLAAL